ncbi:MAG: amidohydrolase [Acidobacteriota bacterium]|nr:amidohydrolase [Acidobacteriota bacterium]
MADAHVHFFSPAFFKSLADQKPDADVPEALGWDEPASAEDLADRWAVELDHANISRAMLIASVPNDTESVGIAVERYPQRFNAVYMANPMLPSPDIRFENAVTEDHVSGVFLFPALHRFSLHENKVWALIQVLAGHSHPIAYVHCGALSMGFRKKLGLASHFDMRYSNPIDLHELASNFPRVKFVIPHFGAGYFREALMVADLCPNIYLDTSSSNSWMRYQTSDLSLSQVFRRALDVVGPSRLLFGSDSSWFPRGWVGKVFDEQTAALREAGAGDETARLIFGGNLMRILAG